MSIEKWWEFEIWVCHFKYTNNIVCNNYVCSNINLKIVCWWVFLFFFLIIMWFWYYYVCILKKWIDIYCIYYFLSHFKGRWYKIPNKQCKIVLYGEILKCSGFLLIINLFYHIIFLDKISTKMTALEDLETREKEIKMMVCLNIF